MKNPSSHPRIIRFYAKVGAPEAIFFISLICLFFIPFITDFKNELLGSVLFTLFVLSLYYLVYTSGVKDKKIITTILFLSIIINWLKHAGFQPSIILEVFFEVFIMVISFYFIFKSIFKTSQINFNTLMAAISGYLLLGIGLGLVVFAFELMNPNSFSFNNVLNTHEAYYYSFVTMSTLGYGDVLPLTIRAKGFSILITLIGQFYMAIVMGLIIGKLLIPVEKTT